MGDGGGAVCVSLSDGDAPFSPELTVGAEGDAVDWYAPPPPWNSPQGGDEIEWAFSGALITASRGNKNNACRDALSLR